MMPLFQHLKRLVARWLSAFTGPRIVYGWPNAGGS